MYNFEEKFENWREQMIRKTEKEQHNYALTISLFITAFVAFFVISKWYFLISGDEFNNSLFTDIENFYNDQKNGIMEK